jgi:hypothetical protein
MSAPRPVLNGDGSGENGLSAYQIAVLYGFSGTEVEWLESLKGEQGPQGNQGEQGPQGYQGEPGLNGIDGTNGQGGGNGADGTNGIDGVDGEDGLSAYQIAVLYGFIGDEVDWLESLKGADGAPGAPGQQGSPGTTSWNGITDKPSTFAPSTHSHAIADVTGLQTAIDGKAASSHTHAATDITTGSLDGDRLPAISTTKKGGVPATGTPSGKFLKDDGTFAGLPVAIQIACSDETTVLTPGVKVTFRMPFAMTLTTARMSVTTAPTGQALIVDVRENGNTIFTAADTGKLVIVGPEKFNSQPTTTTDPALADNAEITINIVQVGGDNKGLKVTLIGLRA